MSAQVFKPSKWTLFFLLLSAMMILMGGAAVAPALPLISQSFPDAPESYISLIITLPALAIALSGVILGVLSDKIGKIRVLIASVAIFTIAGSSGLYLTSLHAILVGRFILGIGIAGITCTTSTLIACYYDGYTRTRVLGYQAAAMGFGVLVLEMSGGFLAGISWRAAFLIYLIGILIFAGIIRTMREPEIPAFERNIKTPQDRFPLPLLLFAYITLFLGNMLFFLLPTKLPYIVESMETAQILGGNAALTSGLLLGISGCASSLTGLFYGRVSWRFHRYSLLVITFLCFGIGYCGLGYFTTFPTLAATVIMIGVAEGILMPTILIWIAAITPPAYMGRASGGFSMALNLGQFASTLAIVPVIAIVLTYSNMFLTFGGVAIILALLYGITIIREKYALTGIAENQKCET